MTTRTLIVLFTIVAMLSAGLAAAVAFAGVPACPVGESALRYPYYSAKGTVVDWNYSCGKAHRGCTPVVINGLSAYECSPFMIPQNHSGLVERVIPESL